ncbi:uncharacterized protein LOC144128885 [Amblyomma americanum]
MAGANPEESVDLVQKRWKSLCDKFCLLYTARQLGRKSGAGADDIEPTDFVWAHYEQPLFLRDTMVTRPKPLVCCWLKWSLLGASGSEDLRKLQAAIQEARSKRGARGKQYAGVPAQQCPRAIRDHH